MNKNHDAIRHLEYLRQSLSQDKMPIGFFLSAGCPLAVSMPEGQWPLIPDISELTKWVNSEIKKDKTYKMLLDELVKAGQNPNNVEDILSFIRGLLSVAKGGEVRGLSESDLVTLEDKVCAKIVEKMDVQLPDQETPFHELSKWITSIVREVPIEIFTTNYDLLMEQALESIEVPYFDGFVGSVKSFFDLRAVAYNLIPKHWTRLWKIHGSINWYQDGDEGQKKVFRSSEIKKDATHLIYPSHLKYEQSRKMPYLALIDQLSKFIRQKSALLIISGYSFSDEHLNYTITDSLKANPTAMVLALMHDSFYIEEKEGELVERYPEAYRLAKARHNLSVWTFDRAIIGTNVGEWQKGKITEDQEILKFIEIEKKDDGQPEDEKTLIKMGDFATFTRFLKMLIGSEKDSTND